MTLKDDLEKKKDKIWKAERDYYREMTYEKQFCCRCTNVHYCIDIDGSWYCKLCFDSVIHDPETKANMNKIMIECGLEDIEKC